MFARQIAVTKGQAWNVVETLKTPDHGPLELTRRTRVCVWDDLVDIPVAIPLRSPSAEMRQKDGARPKAQIDEEEMDISAANGSVPAAREDLIRLSGEAELPNPNRFDLSRHGSFDMPQTPASIGGDFPYSQSSGARRNRAHSYGASGSDRRGSGSGKQRLSITNRYGSFMYEGDDEGDLGYGQARHTEGNTRKVIVERLEAVKSRPPVFTWC